MSELVGRLALRLAPNPDELSKFLPNYGTGRYPAETPLDVALTLMGEPPRGYIYLSATTMLSDLGRSLGRVVPSGEKGWSMKCSSAVSGSMGRTSSGQCAAYMNRLAESLGLGLPAGVTGTARSRSTSVFALSLSRV